MNRRQILGALAPLSTAGCLRLNGSSDGERGVATTAVTSSETTGRTGNEAATDTDPEYPVGLSADAVHDFLPDTHVNTLAFTPFTEVWQSTNVTRSKMRLHRTAHVDEGAALVEWLDGSGITKYSTRSGALWRQPLGDGATYGRERDTFEFQRISRADKLREFVKAGAWDPPTVAASGNAFEITADGYDDVEELKDSWWRVEEMRSFSAEGTVSEDGVITRLLVEFEFVPEHADRVYEARVHHQVKNVGEATVAEPEWYETADERAPELSARITDDRKFVEIRHRGGNPVVEGTAIALSRRDTDDPVEAGTALYLWIEDGEFEWTRGSRPQNADPETLDGRYNVKLLRNGAHYLRTDVG